MEKLNVEQTEQRTNDYEIGNNKIYQERDIMDKELEQGTEIYIKHIRRMSKLTDQEMALLMTSQATENSEILDTLGKMDPNIMEAVDKQIKHVRQMQNLTDEQIKGILLKNNMQEILKEGAIKRNLRDVAKAAKDIHGDPRKFARKVDRI